VKMDGGVLRWRFCKTIDVQSRVNGKKTTHTHTHTHIQTVTHIERRFNNIHMQSTNNCENETQSVFCN